MVLQYDTVFKLTCDQQLSITDISIQVYASDWYGYGFESIRSNLKTDLAYDVISFTIRLTEYYLV